MKRAYLALALLAVLIGMPLLLAAVFDNDDCDGPCGSNLGIIIAYVWSFVVVLGLAALAIYIVLRAAARLRDRR